MSIDTPATIVVLGAGPLGLEAALYARYLGYTVEVYERGRIAESWRQAAHVRMLSPFGSNRSPLGLAALAAQDPDWRPPADDALLTAGEYVERYLLPLAGSDLLDGAIREGTNVLAVAPDATAPREVDANVQEEESDEETDEADANEDDATKVDAREEDDAWIDAEPDERHPRFRLLLEDGDGERAVWADAVLDATGLTGEPWGLGPGGMPAVGERRAARHFDRGMPDVLGRDRERFAGRRVLVVGYDLDAAQNIVALAELAAADPETRVVWIAPATDDAGPLSPIENDPLPERDRLVRAASALAAGGRIEHWPGATVERVRWKRSAGQFTLRTGGARREKLKVDRVVANTGRRASELLLCLAQPMERALHYHVLDHDAQAKAADPTITAGLDQIRCAFAIIVGRAGLDLYATAGPAAR